MNVLSLSILNLICFYLFIADYENESLADTVFSYKSYEHPENNLLRAASTVYSHSINPFGADDSSLASDHVTVEDESVDDTTSESASSIRSLDPTLPIVSASMRALSGVRLKVDFVRELPVHISKYILSFLDYPDLVECFRVSPHWCYIGKEVEEDAKLRQILWEEVMLMQVRHGLYRRGRRGGGHSPHDSLP